MGIRPPSPEQLQALAVFAFAVLCAVAAGGLVWTLLRRANEHPVEAPVAVVLPRALTDREAAALTLLLESEFGDMAEPALRAALAKRGAVLTTSGFHYVMGLLLSAGLVRTWHGTIFTEAGRGPVRYFGLTDAGYDLASGIGLGGAA